MDKSKENTRIYDFVRLIRLNDQRLCNKIIMGIKNPAILENFINSDYNWNLNYAMAAGLIDKDDVNFLNSILGISYQYVWEKEHLPGGGVSSYYVFKEATRDGIPENLNLDIESIKHYAERKLKQAVKKMKTCIIFRLYCSAAMAARTSSSLMLRKRAI